MRIILLLCATLALTISAVPVEEVAATQETHPDVELPVETEVEKVKIVFNGKVCSCPTDWSKFGSRCFRFINKEVPWADAERYCLRYGTNLASIHSPEEYDFVQEVVRGNTGRYPQTWLGGHDAVKDFVWFWSDGSSFHYKDWSFDEPNNAGYREKCVVMNLSEYGDFLWGDVNCVLRLPFVCGTKPL